MNLERWQGLMRRLSLDSNSHTYGELYDAYSEKHRHYHTVQHIDHCLGLIDEYRELAPNPDEVELALWFHDAIYKPTSNDNEALSAAWAEKFLVANKVHRASIDRVIGLIMATVHETPAEERNAQLLVDIDLSILGAGVETYNDFEANVRREYRWVPGPIYRRERRKILQSFVDREYIYAIEALRDRFESQARVNLASAIRRL